MYSPPRSRRSSSSPRCTSTTPRPCCPCTTASPSSRTSPRRSAARAKQSWSSFALVLPASRIAFSGRGTPPSPSARVPVTGVPGPTERDPPLWSRNVMPLYVIEHGIPDGLGLAPTQAGQAASTVIGNNARLGVTWLHSYVTPDKKRTFFIYDSPTPEAVRKAAERNKLPVGRITEVRVLDPYFHK